MPLPRVLSALLSADPILLLVAFGLTAIGIVLSSVKLNLVLAALSTPVSFGKALRAYYVGTFFNNFIPTSVGGDVVKVLELNRHESTNFSNNSLTVIIERLFGILVLFGIAGVFLIWTPGWYREVGLSFLQDGRNWLLAVVVVTVLAVCLNYFLKTDEKETVSSWKKRTREWLRFPVDNPGTTLSVLGLSALFHGLRALTFVLLGASLGFEISFSVALFVLPIIAFASFLPISLGGIGLREGIITFCLYTFGLPLEVSLSLSLLVRAFSIVHSGLGGMIYLSSTGRTMLDVSRR